MLLYCGKKSSEAVVPITWKTGHVLLRLALRKLVGKIQNDSVCWLLLVSDYKKEIDVNLASERWASEEPSKEFKMARK